MVYVFKGLKPYVQEAHEKSDCNLLHVGHASATWHAKQIQGLLSQLPGVPVEARSDVAKHVDEAYLSLVSLAEACMVAIREVYDELGIPMPGSEEPKEPEHFGYVSVVEPEAGQEMVYDGLPYEPDSYPEAKPKKKPSKG